MWIVHLALRRPYTFVCVAILMLVFGVLSILRTPVDIFPAINIPVVSVVWNYGGLAPRDMEQRIVTTAERVVLQRGERHRAHRVGIAERHCADQGVLSADCRHLHRCCADHGLVAADHPLDAAGNHAAAHLSLQRHRRSHPPARDQQPAAYGSRSSTTSRTISFARRWQRSAASRSRPRAGASPASSTSTSIRRSSSRRGFRRRT